LEHVQRRPIYQGKRPVCWVLDLQCRRCSPGKPPGKPKGRSCLGFSPRTL
ncbi:unnamed protein product, partial [Prunus brigantina]